MFILILLIFGMHCEPRSSQSTSQLLDQSHQLDEARSEPETSSCNFSAYKAVSLGFSTTGYATSLPKPIYPPEAKKQKVEGQVTMKLLISVRSGIVERACIVKGGRVFERVSSEAALRSKFSFSGTKALPKRYSYAEGVLIYNFVSQ